MIETAESRIDDDGRVRIPERIRQHVDLEIGDPVSLRVEGDSVRLERDRDALEEFASAIPKREEPDEIDLDGRPRRR
jgi:bifunctional DNA-binding transcriptional regulator/antitoxin component of YhaV-PrlF toxin-antitoxin module